MRPLITNSDKSDKQPNGCLHRAAVIRLPDTFNLDRSKVAYPRDLSRKLHPGCNVHRRRPAEGASSVITRVRQDIEAVTYL